MRYESWGRVLVWLKAVDRGKEGSWECGARSGWELGQKESNGLKGVGCGV